MTDAAKKLYPTNHTGPKKKTKDALITHPAGGTSKVSQQQKPARPANAAAKK